MAMKMKGIYKSFKMVSQLFVVKERDIEIGHPTEVKHVVHVGWEVPSGSAPAWLSEFTADAEPLSPTPPSSCHARHSKSSLTTSSSTDFDQISSRPPRPPIADRPRDVPPIPVGLPKIDTKSKNRRNNSSSTSSPNPNYHLKNLHDKRVSKYSFKSMTFRSNSNA